MSGLYLGEGLFPQDFLQPTVSFLLAEQRPSGEIPWFNGGHSDPWNHVEAAMGLSIGGELAAARRAYEWLRSQQLDDGSWWARYQQGVPEAAADTAARRESNFVAYIATGVWHHYLISADSDFLQAMWACVSRAIDFVLTLQSPEGDIDWAVDAKGEPLGDALITGCCSIYKSLECAHNIAVTLGQPRPDWLRARRALGAALRQRPQRFDRTWQSKARYSMDWFYPVLCGAIEGAAARARLAARWQDFVKPGLGCRCVADQPWATVAETCELVMALLAAGERVRAVEVYSWLQQWRVEGGGAYWTGYQWLEDVLWPDEQPTWTAAAILLAADALCGYSAASRLFCEVTLLSLSQSGQSHKASRKQGRAD
ncbi:MAG: prenyltransferase [Parahaliea sp.]